MSHKGASFDRAQRDWDEREPRYSDPKDCETCGNTGEVCGLHQEPFDDCPCDFSRAQCEAEHTDECPADECEWRDQ
jgi:hypothetical protein